MQGYSPFSKNITTKGMAIWESIPTPLYNEMISSKTGDMVKNENNFWSYVQRLKDIYPQCKVDVDPRGPYSSKSGNTFQRFEASKGGNYYNDFLRQEKACQIQQIYKRVNIVPAAFYRGRYMKNNIKEIPIQTTTDLYQYLEEKEKEDKRIEMNRLANEEEHRKRKEDEEKARYAGVKQGNLLGLYQEPEINLLSFGATKEGLNSRIAELSNLNFYTGGKKKTRRSRKSKKTRKTKRN